MGSVAFFLQVLPDDFPNHFGYGMYILSLPVSYTHLDVYKRQGNTQSYRRLVLYRRLPHTRRQQGGEPVSYTHLDVYKRQVKVFPNPAQNYTLVGVPEEIKYINLVNLAGNQLIKKETQGGRVINLDVNTLPKGTYLLLFYTNKGFVGSKKLIKN